MQVFLNKHSLVSRWVLSTFLTVTGPPILTTPLDEGFGTTNGGSFGTTVLGIDGLIWIFKLELPPVKN